MAFPGRRLQKTTPMYPSFPANLSSVSSRLRSTRYSDFTERRLHELYPCSGPALLTNGIALMCHSFAPFPNLTHFLREDGLGTRQSLVGVCSLNQPVKHELPQGSANRARETSFGCTCFTRVHEPRLSKRSGHESGTEGSGPGRGLGRSRWMVDGN